MLASYRRLTWEADLPPDYVRDHLKWRVHAELDLSFEQVTSRPEAALRELAGRLGLCGAADVAWVLRHLAHLPVPRDWVDPVTQVCVCGWVGGGGGG